MSQEPVLSNKRTHAVRILYTARESSPLFTANKESPHAAKTKCSPQLLLFSCSVMSDSLPPHGLQHARLPCPSPSSGACSNSCPLSWWCYPTISSSIIPFSCFQSLPASGSFPVSQLLVSGGQSIGASASVLSMNIQDSQESSPIPHFKRINYSALSLYGPILTSIHDYWKNHSFDYRDLCWESNVSVFLIHCIGLS